MIIIVSVNISYVSPSVASVLNSLQITLYTVPPAISVMCTYLISHRIYFGLFQSEDSRHVRSPKLRKIIDIIVQSSLAYTVMLVCVAASDVTTPNSKRPIVMQTIHTLMSYLLGPVSVFNSYLTNRKKKRLNIQIRQGIAPTLMVARVGLLSAKFTGTTMEEESRHHFVPIQFARSQECESGIIVADKEQDTTDNKV